jgi:cation:H+ antiporter
MHGLMAWAQLVASLLVILLGAELFTNGVEWVGEGLGLTEGAVGSVLAAIGTALPETLLPLVAILSGHANGDEIGVGAILGAPLMLSTIALFGFAFTVLLVSRRGSRSPEIEHDPGVVAADLRIFLLLYGLAFLAGLVPVRAVHIALAPVLIVGYGVFVRRQFRSPSKQVVEAEAVGEVRPLRFAALFGRRGTPGIALSGAQTLVGLGVLLGGAELFVHGVKGATDALGVSPLTFSLLVAPLATELPEALNASVIWARRGKDVLALGNIAGAMVFQSTFPVVIGLLFTTWRLDAVGAVAAITTLVAAATVLLSIRVRGRLSPRPLLWQGAFYLAYVAYVIVRPR